MKCPFKRPFIHSKTRDKNIRFQEMIDKSREKKLEARIESNFLPHWMLVMSDDDDGDSRRCNVFLCQAEPFI